MLRSCHSAWNLIAKTFSQGWLIAGVVLMTAAAHAAVDVSLVWNPSSDVDVAGYKIYYGTASRSYTASMDVGNVTNTTITGLTGNTTYYFAATTYNSNGVESDFSNEASYLTTNTTPPVTYQPPTLDPVANLSINENAGAQTVNLTGISPGTGQILAITAVSSNPSLIPNPTVNYTSPNGAGSLHFTPAANQSGSALITVTANNGQAESNIVTRVFTVTVAHVYQPPTLAAIGNVSIAENAGAQTLNLSGISLGSGQSLTITAVSSNPSLIPDPTINYVSPAGSGDLSFAPAANRYGSAIITVTANNGEAQSNIVTRTFTVNVAAVNEPPTLDALNNVSLNENAGAQTVNLTGISLGTGPAVSITAMSSNPALVPTPTITYQSPAATGALQFVPASNAHGTAVITVTANNGLPQSNTVTRSFTVNIAALNLPTLDPVGDVKLAYNSRPQAILLSGVTAGTGNDNRRVKISAVSSNPNVVEAWRTHYNLRNNNGTLVLKPASDASGTSTVSVTVDNGQPENNLITKTFTVTVASNQPPTLAAIPDVTLAYNSRPQTIDLTGISTGSPDERQRLKITAVSSDPSVVPDPHANCNSRNGTGKLMLKPMRDASGTAIISVTIDDGQAQNHLVMRNFKVTVAPNQPPTLDPIADVSLAYDSRPQAINLSGITVGSEDEKQHLKITAVSSNPNVVAAPHARYNHRDGTGSLLLKPGSHISGTALVTVTVDDGQSQHNTITRTFTVTVEPNRPPTLDPVANVILPFDSKPVTVDLTGISVGSPNENQKLKMTAVSSNPDLVAAPHVKCNLRNGTGNLLLKPQSNTNGTAVITITLDDGSAANNLFTRTFNVTIAPEITAAASVASSVPATLTAPVTSGGQFSFQVEGLPGNRYAVQVSSDLVHWTSVETNQAPYVFKDVNAAQYARRFYRTVNVP